MSSVISESKSYSDGLSEILQEEHTKINHSGTIVCNLNIWGFESFISFKAKHL